MNSHPSVTVLIPFYNSEAYLEAAIDSVLRQTFTDLEVLLVDDGSTDASRAIVQGYDDPRIRMISNDKNQGVVYSRNKGVQEAKAPLVAVLDADDIAVPDRIASQYAYMNSHPQLMMVGGHAEVINAEGKPTGEYYKMPTGTAAVPIELLFRNVFVNSTVVFRKQAVQTIGGYEGWAYAEDYRLAFRLAERFPVDNLDKVLVQYRLHDQNISKTSELIKKGEEELVRYMHQQLGLPKDDQLQNTHLSFIHPTLERKPNLTDYYNLFSALRKGNENAGLFPEEALNKELFMRWYALIRQSRSKHSLHLFFKKPLFHPRYANCKMYRKVFKQAMGLANR